MSSPSDSSTPGATCGAGGDDGCPPDQYCDFGDNQCGALDVPGTSVCACNGMVCGNDCEAAATGHDLNDFGGCPAPAMTCSNAAIASAAKA